MNRISEAFNKKKKNILSIYFTAGYKGLNKSIEIIKNLEDSGVDIVELGMPFSDPVADGPIIQKSSETALSHGMSVKQLFEELKDLRKQVSIPVLLMGYLNPIIQYGVEEFCKRCSEVGIDGVIIPDLPLDVYERHYESIFENYRITNTLLVTPQTNDIRIKQIDKKSNGFIYVVSSNGTTGDNKAILHNDYFAHIKSLQLKTPTLIGFGIKDNKSFLNACEYANGAIIGSSFVKHIESSCSTKHIKSFVDEIVKS
ncbi:tryptophan synthase subunit alpha [Halosquirtibacter xylanolyticus]|uniref:tryptophan synthase subunit alpha n=1 Tax=Halosquirtibacter xylanolyticus TaxID=3374599 RepID=UPI0037495464|nr:tryptophan synthase subunit alpha [Prolixibacteraceae bacterium]